jgi:hypothetical protein
MVSLSCDNQGMDQGVATVLAAVIALVGVIAGLVGVVIGGRISGNAAREAAKIAAAASDADREEAKAARFADRVRELATQMLDAASQYVFACNDIYNRAQWDKTASSETGPPLSHGFGQAGQELRLLVRLPETYAAIDRLEAATLNVQFQFTLFEVFTSDAAWKQAQHGHAAAVQRFEDAFRVELGQPPIERPAAELQADHDAGSVA